MIFVLIFALLVVFLLAIAISLKFTKKPTRLVKSKPKKKIAVVYFGLLRSLKDVYKSHFQNIFNVLKNNNIEYKVFIHTWRTKGDVQRVWYKEVEEKQDYTQHKLLNPYKYRIDSQEKFENALQFDKYFYADEMRANKKK